MSSNSSSDEMEFNEFDVLCGQNVKSELMKEHSGNVMIKKLLLTSVDDYRPKDNRSKVVNDIITTVKKQGGRFLYKESKDGPWIEQDDKKNRDKLSSALLYLTRLNPEQLEQKRKQLLEIEEKLQERKRKQQLPPLELVTTSSGRSTKRRRREYNDDNNNNKSISITNVPTNDIYYNHHHSPPSPWMEPTHTTFVSIPTSQCHYHYHDNPYDDIIHAPDEAIITTETKVEADKDHKITPSISWLLSLPEPTNNNRDYNINNSRYYPRKTDYTSRQITEPNTPPIQYPTYNSSCYINGKVNISAFDNDNRIMFDRTITTTAAPAAASVMMKSNSTESYTESAWSFSERQQYINADSNNQYPPNKIDTYVTHSIDTEDQFSTDMFVPQVTEPYNNTTTVDEDSTIQQSNCNINLNSNKLNTFDNRSRTSSDHIKVALSDYPPAVSEFSNDDTIMENPSIATHSIDPNYQHQTIHESIPPMMVETVTRILDDDHDDDRIHQSVLLLSDPTTVSDVTTIDEPYPVNWTLFLNELDDDYDELIEFSFLSNE